ncbi:hypothetical protein BC936DRAFT_144639 [Jimgerdemannia flammicorona]|uniref:BTB/POZ protein n=1 Tax=Jimgerdemannia flammicorona TaxID=994334 RepID=A0A433DC40_9FUNG|nr:hypothetical protein BC936DRAFT_144639 [Jimgerdemannia flammicorona]
MPTEARTFSFTWKIGKIAELERKKPHKSPTEYTSEKDGWSATLRIYSLAKSRKRQEFMSVYLSAEPDKNNPNGFRERKNVEFTVLFRSVATNEIVLVKHTPKTHDFLSTTEVFGFENFCRLNAVDEYDDLAIEVRISRPMPELHPYEFVDFLFTLRPVDVRFNVNGQLIGANKEILASRSDYFRSMFTCGLKESQEDPEGVVVHVPNTSEPAFKAMLWFLYTGLLNLESFPGANERDVFHLADMYQLDKLTELLKWEIIWDLTPETAFRCLLEFAHAYPSLKKLVLDYVVGNFDAIRRTDEFAGLMEDHDDIEYFGEVMTEIMRLLNLASN